MKPKLSIVLPAMLGYDAVLAALHSWETQTCRDQLEILVLCPDHLGPTPGQRAALPPGQIVVPVGSADLHEARVIGIQRASADYVMLAEDHCVPDPDWAQAILPRLDQGWDAVGSALRPGSRNGSWALAAFLIGYGEWMNPTAGKTEVLCGWNGTIRTEALRKLGPELNEKVVLGAFLVRRLREQGQRFFIEDRARMRHFDKPGRAEEILMFVTVGLGFGAFRTRSWPLVARLLYPFAVPAIAWLHWKRAAAQYRRAGAVFDMRPAALVAAVVLASAWGLGEGVGALAGSDRVRPYLWRTEVRPLAPEEMARSTAQERLAPLPPDSLASRIPSRS